MLFYYKGIDEFGKDVSGTIDAADLNDAKAKLKANKILFLYVKKPFALFDAFFKKPVSDKELAIFLQDLGIYLKAGISVASALKLCKTQYENNKKFSNFINEIYRMITEGSSLYNALKKQTFLSFPSFIIQTIKVAEEGGFLPIACFKLADFLKQRDKIASNVKKAIAYPSFIIVVSMILVTLMLTLVVPVMADIFETNHQALPTITKIVLAISGFLIENKISLMLLLLLILLSFYYGMKKNYNFRFYIHNLILKTPFFGKIIQTSQLSRFLYITAMLNQSGTPLTQAIHYAAETIDNEVLKSILTEISNSVVGGAKLSSSVARYKILDKSLSGTLFLGEESGQSIDAIIALSQKYEEENQNKTEIALSLLEPFLMVVVGAVVGTIVAAMLLPIVNISLGS